MKKNLLLLISTSLFPLIAFADLKKPNNYIEIGGIGMTYKESGLTETWKPTAAKFTLGQNISKNVAVELVVGTSVSGSTVNIGGTIPTTIKVGPFFGMYLRPSIPLGDSAEIFLRAGFLRSKLTATLPGVEVWSTDTSFSYGAGISLKIAENISTTADYMQYYNKYGTTVTGIGVGLKSDF